MLQGRQGRPVSGILDKAMSGKIFFHQEKKGEHKTGEIELGCVYVFWGKDVLFFYVEELTGTEFSHSMLEKLKEWHEKSE